MYKVLFVVLIGWILLGLYLDRRYTSHTVIVHTVHPPIKDTWQDKETGLCLATTDGSNVFVVPCTWDVLKKAGRIKK